MSGLNPFHLAFPVHSLSEARSFYLDILGCSEGRSGEQWVDFNFYGHQIVAHLVDGYAGDSSVNHVDGDDIPVRHFGIVLGMKEWSELSNKLQYAKVKFLVEPHIRFEGLAGEQATMFIRDSSGNALEFKAFKDKSFLFTK
ncbi:VOC family protein [Burkholderiales bacterium]|nr:VOC family protein [Burkholderiales bacterium]